jgi:glycine C-acetyltransferase/8-amino-7-oxononanoate synthase
VAAAGLGSEIDVIVGTLGKALGSYGAYVCCDADIASLLVNTARTLIFSTGPPPPSAAAALGALELLREQPRQVERVLTNATALRDALAENGFAVSGGGTQIVPLIIGDPDVAVEVCERALQRGVFAQAIRPPTVPPGSSRLRLTAMATHRPTELRWAAEQLAAATREAGARPPTLDDRVHELFVYDEEEDEPALAKTGRA